VINNKATSTQQQTGRIANVLIAEDSPQAEQLILRIFARRGVRGIIAKDEKTAVDFLEKSDCELVMTGITLRPRPDAPPKTQGGFSLVRKIRESRPELPIVMIAPSETSKEHNARRLVDSAVRAIRSGCRDFLLEPIEADKIELLLDRLLPGHPVATIASAQEDTRSIYQIVGRSVRLSQTVTLARKIAGTSAAVLITGESGTGKELIAYLIHHSSRRAQGPYIRLNCAALSETLLESELFGHEKGAFTGAHVLRKGRFETAHGGTLLLDEITETPIKFQAKLLRVLEQQRFERVGGSDNIKVDVRIISTTNKDLAREVSAGRFREDLYYRLNGLRVVLSPLRQRCEDLPDLVWHFVNLYSAQSQRRITKLDPAMMKIFANYAWPGNVRQLRNVVLTALILGSGETLTLADASWLFDELQPRTELPTETESEPDEQARNAGRLGGIPLAHVERRAILDTLAATNGNQTKAAKVLGISDRTLRDKVRRYRRQECLQPDLITAGQS